MASERYSSSGAWTRLCSVILFIVICLGSISVSAKVRYRPGDWVSYSNFRFVNAIAMDQRFVYFGTTGGISRYDLYEQAWAEPFTTSDGLIDNHVNVVAIDPVFNDLWCATRGGISRYNDGTKTWTTYKTGGGMFLDNVRSIGVTDDERLVFETPGGTVAFDVARQLWELSTPSNGINSRQPTIMRWYGARGRGRYKDSYPLFNTDFKYIFNPPESIQDQYFRSYPLTTFLEDSFANVWIGTWGLNVGRASLRTFKLDMLRIGLVSRSVTAMKFDGNDIWFGGYEGNQDLGGITRYNRSSQEWTHYQSLDTQGLHSGTISDIVVDTTEVWFGTDNGVVSYDKKEDQWTTLPIQKLTSSRITALARNDTTLWIGTTAGVNRLNIKTRLIEPILIPALRNLIIYDITVDRFRDIWMATDRGVYRQRTDRGWKKIEDPNSVNLNRPVYVVKMDGNAIWFGVGSLLLKYTRSTGRWQEWQVPITVSGRQLSMNVSDTFIWIGSRSGAARFDKTRERWTVYTREDGLLENTVQSLLLDGNYIWFGTREGVTRFYWNDATRLD